MSHRIGWQDDGMASVRSCGATALGEDLVLVAPDGPMSDGPSSDHSQPCPVCGKRLTLRWAVRIEEAP